MIKAETIMHKRIGVNPSSTLREVAYKIMSSGLPGMPVIDNDNTLHGVVTEFDLLRAIHQGSDLDSTKAEDIMINNPVTANRDTPIEEIVDTMIENHFTMIPISENNKLIGVVSRDKVLEVYVEPGVWDYEKE